MLYHFVKTPSLILLLARRSPSRYAHPSRVAESKQPILAQSYAKLGRENPTVEKDRRERERRRRIVSQGMYIHTVSGMTPSSLVPSAPLSYARSERDYLARRERANIGSYSSRLYGAYVPTGFLRAFPTYPPRAASPPLFQLSRRTVPPSFTRISTPLLSAPCIFGSTREIRRFCRSGSTLSQGVVAIYRPGISVARKSFAIKDPLSLTRYL